MISGEWGRLELECGVRVPQVWQTNSRLTSTHHYVCGESFEFVAGWGMKMYGCEITRQGCCGLEFPESFENTVFSDFYILAPSVD
jgi:hypothetical protein